MRAKLGSINVCGAHAEKLIETVRKVRNEWLQQIPSPRNPSRRSTSTQDAATDTPNDENETTNKRQKIESQGSFSTHAVTPVRRELSLNIPAQGDSFQRSTTTAASNIASTPELAWDSSSGLVVHGFPSFGGSSATATMQEQPLLLLANIAECFRAEASTQSVGIPVQHAAWLLAQAAAAQPQPGTTHRPSQQFFHDCLRQGPEQVQPAFLSSLFYPDMGMLRPLKNKATCSLMS
jgi:hypothetical protein